MPNDTNATKLYETLILVEQSAAANDMDDVLSHVREILERSEAEILTLHRWDERKLSYAIKKQTRGTFLLTLFNVNPQKIAIIEREFNLSDQVLRVMFIAADHMGEDEIEQTIEAGKKAADTSKLQEQKAEDEQSQDGSSEALNQDENDAIEDSADAQENSENEQAKELVNETA